MNDQYRGLLYASMTALLWGFLAIALKMAVTDLSPVTVVWYRFASAFLILASYTLIFRRRDFNIYRKFPLRLLLTALFLGFNYLGFISGIKYVSPSSSQVFIMVGPITFALSGILIFKEHVNWRHISGFILVVMGILMFYSEQIADLAGTDHHFTKGMVLIFGGGLSWAVFASLQKTLVHKYSTNQLNLFIYSFCALGFLPFIQFFKFPGLSPGDYALLTFLGLNTVLAYGSLALAIKFTEANKVSVIITLNPIITFVTMAILTRLNVGWVEHESFSSLSIIGALTVLSGAIVVIMAGGRRNAT
ncbi:MAG: DMT family transporter [Bacteroidales bacterium]|nr:DMT family transporter [Bacteroidales bacterium]